MSLVPRLIISIMLTFLIFVGYVKYFNVPPDRYLPPPMLYKNCTEKTQGVITDKHVAPYGEHLMEGSDDQYYVLYKFQGFRHERDAQGRLDTIPDPTWYTGAVRVQHVIFDGITAGEAVDVVFDPDNPNINGAPDSLTYWSKSTGWINPYLWYWLAMLAAVYIFQEILKAITKASE